MGFKKGEVVVSDRNQGKQFVVLQHLGDGRIYVYRSLSDVARDAGVRPGTLRNLVSRGENEFRGYRVTRVKSFGGIEFGVVPERVEGVVEVVKAKEEKKVKTSVKSSFEVMQELSGLPRIPSSVLGGGGDVLDLDSEF
jgi:hypothetical protein